MSPYRLVKGLTIQQHVKSVLLFGSECWQVTAQDMKKIDAFYNRCLRKICCIFWPERICNKDLHRKNKCSSLVLQIKCCCLRWLGLVFRMGQGQIPKAALRWTPLGKRRQGRLKISPGMRRISEWVILLVWLVPKSVPNCRCLLGGTLSFCETPERWHRLDNFPWTHIDKVVRSKRVKFQCWWTIPLIQKKTTTIPLWQTF